MASSMQPGKRYRMRQDGKQWFVDGYFLDQRFYEGPNAHIGDVEADGAFRYRSRNEQGTPKYPDDLAGKVEGLRLVREDGTEFDLVEVSEER